jgi:hypothetical protein
VNIFSPNTCAVKTCFWINIPICKSAISPDHRAVDIDDYEPPSPAGVGVGIVLDELAATRRWLLNYRPQTIPDAAWQPVRPFVIPAVGSLGVSLIATKRYASILAKLAVWASAEGTTLDCEVLLDPETVERFCTTALRGDPSAGTYRSSLRYLGRRLTRHAPWDPPPTPLRRRMVAHPYSNAQVRRLERVVVEQPTPARRRAAEAIFVLGLGAGLDGRWIPRISSQNVIKTSDGCVLVRLESHIVPCRARYVTRLLDLVDTSNGEFLIGGTSNDRNRFSNVQHSLVTDAQGLRLTAKRLRATWLVHHLAAGTRLPELMNAAGLQSVVVLSDLLPNVPAMAGESAAAERAAWRMLSQV